MIVAYSRKNVQIGRDLATRGGLWGGRPSASADRRIRRQKFVRQKSAGKKLQRAELAAEFC